MSHKLLSHNYTFKAPVSRFGEAPSLPPHIEYYVYGLQQDATGEWYIMGFVHFKLAKKPHQVQALAPSYYWSAKDDAWTYCYRIKRECAAVYVDSDCPFHLDEVLSESSSSSSE